MFTERTLYVSLYSTLFLCSYVLKHTHTYIYLYIYIYIYRVVRSKVFLVRPLVDPVGRSKMDRIGSDRDRGSKCFRNAGS